MKKFTLPFFLSAVVCIIGHAQYLDSSFGDDGIVLYSDSPEFEIISGIAVQDDGKIVGVGQYILETEPLAMVVRMLPDGSPDPDFGTAGFVTLSPVLYSNFTSVMIDTEERIIATGGRSGLLAVARFLPDGTPDSTFSDDGVSVVTGPMTSSGRSIAMQSDGRIVVGGSTAYDFMAEPDALVVRFNTDGSVDDTFGIDGYFQLDMEEMADVIHSIAVDADDRIVYAGISHVSSSFSGLCGRLSADGVQDISFATGGNFLYDHGPFADVLIAANDDVLAAGYVVDDILVVRLDNGGVPVTTFGTEGHVLHDPGMPVAMQGLCEVADGSIVVGTNTTVSDDYQFVLTHYNSAGETDADFGGGSGFITSGPILNYISSATAGMALQPDGKVLMSAVSNINDPLSGLVVRFDAGLPANVAAPEAQDLLLWPNPAKNEVWISGANSQKPGEYSIYNSYGQLIRAGIVRNRHSIDVSELNTGIYVLKMAGLAARFEKE